MSNKKDWYKNNRSDNIWWLATPEQIGVWIFSFDKKKEFNLFKDYPNSLTKEEKVIFDKENPEWVIFFKERQ